MSAGGGNHGKAGEEMFLNRPSQSNATVEPLRINKRDAVSPDPYQQNANGPPPATALPALPGQAGSGNPLPYPDDRDRQRRQRPSDASKNQLPYPDNASDRINTPDSARTSSPAYPAPSPQNEYPSQLRPQGGKSGATLAERRGGAAPKPLPDSPGPDTPDKDGLFQKFPSRDRAGSGQGKPAEPEVNPFPDYHQQYWPPPGGAGAGAQPRAGSQGGLKPQQGVNRISSTASTSTTRAQRGSPPPPETPILPPGEQPGSRIEDRFAAANIAGTSTLTSLQAQNAAAQQRANAYAQQQRQGGQRQPEPVRRPWTPTEQPGSQPHGPPTVYQGPGEANESPPVQVPTPTRANVPTSPRVPTNALEQDMARLNVNHSPPPAYSSVSGGQPAGQYPMEKHPIQTNVPSASVASTSAPSASSIMPSSTQTHPAFANDARSQSISSQHTVRNDLPIQQHASFSLQSPSPGPAGATPASPPPLPEGWIAHLDPNSGQYYYIHLPSQSTQWEFPKGPTPLNLTDAPLSPVGAGGFGNPLASPGLSSFGKQPLASPGFPGTPGYAESVMSLNTAPGSSGVFTGPPPSSGVDLYKVAPTNGVYFGPYLRYTNMDIERGLWLGSILLVTDAPQPPTIHIHQSIDLSPNPRQLKAVNISTHQRWTFYKYEIDLQMDDAGPAKWTYAITSHLGCTRYEFLVAGRYETNWRFVATSGNDFSLNTNANERARLGGVGYMWKDVMQKHVECGGFHCQLGLGSQIYADRLWKEIPSLKQWLVISGKENRKNAAWTAAHEEDVGHAYFHYYTSHFDQPHLREAFAQIPQVCQIDDHDIFDGFGSYPEYMQFSNMFKNIGRLGIETYLLFQHHTTLEILRNVSTDIDLFTITGTGWHFVKFLGPAVAVIGPDTRSERNPHQVMAGPTYQGLFPKVAMLPPSVQHCIWMIAVPIVYPRLEAAEQFANTVATGKKAVTGAYNVLGKVTSSVAGVVGAKGAVGSGFDSVKRAVGKSGLMGGILSPFGDIDVLDELKDQWTHESKDLERTYLIRTLQGIAHQKSIRMTFLSGSTSLCGAGLLHDPSHPSDHKTMYQLISSSIVSAPPPNYVLKLLHNNKPLYIPANGHRSGKVGEMQVSDTKEDMMEIFATDPQTGVQLGYRKLLPRRNYVAVVAYDPEAVQGTFGTAVGGGSPGSGHGSGRLSLAADFMCQGEGAYGGVVKFGPVVVPGLEYGR